MILGRKHPLTEQLPLGTTFADDTQALSNQSLLQDHHVWGGNVCQISLLRAEAGSQFHPDDASPPRVARD